MKDIRALGISPGIAMGPIYIYECEDIVIEPCSCIDPEYEVERFQLSLETARAQLQEVYEKAVESTGQQEADIFEAHMMILEDPEIIEHVIESIEKNLNKAEYAWYKAIDKQVEIMASMKDEYFAARSADINDVGQRVLRILVGNASKTVLDRPSIIVATDLTPSDTVSFDKNKVLAFATVKGGPTSHVAILSKALGIPAIVGIGAWIKDMKSGMMAILDGGEGKIILDPPEAIQEDYRRRALNFEEDFQSAYKSAKLPAVTKDGVIPEVVANIGSPEAAAEALDFGAEGIGLLRTEFLFLERDLPPDEDEQVEVYRFILNHFGDKPVVIRTLDIGGDKPAPYLKISPELNPFLGVRGTRLTLLREDIFQTQLRALFRAGLGYNLKIMFPMIGTITDIRKARIHIEKAIETIKDNGHNYSKNIEIGIMVEIPSAAVMSDVLAGEVDFFSIGTNDLTQYTLAADRTNPEVAEQADALDPAVLRLIHIVIQAAHKKGKWVGLCGELAGETLAVPVLLGFGLDEFSMNPRAIPYVKRALRKMNAQDARKISARVLELSCAEDVKDYLHKIEAL
jgi:phosphotransferase system enzyme I (PtsI)